MQVRFFQEPDIADLEAAVNAWLAADPRREIVEVRQSVVPTAAGGREILIGIWHIED